jgi:hypothetical protein
MRWLLLPSLLSFSTIGLFAEQQKFPEKGIAAKYPGDAGIVHDPRVIFAEDFEEPSTEALWKNWESIADKGGQSFTDDVPPGSAGKHSLLMDRQ